jgi:hypothetical protein
MELRRIHGHMTDGIGTQRSFGFHVFSTSTPSVQNKSRPEGND